MFTYMYAYSVLSADVPQTAVKVRKWMNNYTHFLFGFCLLIDPRTSTVI